MFGGRKTTTFNVGHFNLWPQQLDPESITGGTVDWGRAGVPPGMDYPSLGSFELSPAEILTRPSLIMCASRSSSV